MFRESFSPAMQSPLHHFGLAGQAVPLNASKGVWASELPLLGYISLRGNAQDAAFLDVAASVLGTPLPTQPCTLAWSEVGKILWLSPDEWMIVCSRVRLAALIDDLAHALSGIRSQVADNSGGYTQVFLQGRNAQDLLSHTSVYDVASLQPGRIVGTTFGKSSLHLHRQDDGFCLMLRRSFADYLWRYLVRAAAPYGFGVAQLEMASRRVKVQAA